MEKSIISEEKIQKFDDVHIKSMNLSGVVYAIKGKDVVVNTLKKGLVKTKMDDLKKIYTETINEADVVGKTVFSDGRGKLHFGYYKTDDAVEFVDYKTWAKLSFKDVSKGDTNKDRVVNAILKNQKQFNKKVDYNMWVKKTNPSFEQKMDWFIKNGWISNINKSGIKESIHSVNEGAMSDIDIIAQESKDFKEFVKKFFSEYKDFAKTKESLKWLEDIYKGRTKMEGLERVADALPQTEEEPVNEEEKSPEEILKGLREMALGDLERIEDYAEMIADRMEEGQELSSWMYSQITLAVDQLNSVHDALDGKDGIKEAELPKAMIPGPIKAKLTMAIDKIKDTNLSYPQKLQVIGKIIDSLGIDKKELAKISSRLKGTLESVNEAKTITIKFNDNDQTLYFSDGQKAKVDYDGEFKYKGKWFDTSEMTEPEDLEKMLAKAFPGVKFIQKESIKEHKDCGCGCKGTTVGGCNTSLTEVQLNEWRAEEVLQQLGGRKFIVMTGAKNFVKNDKEKSITFKLPKAKSGINYIRITLTSMDVYNVDFISVRGTNIKTVATEKGVYNDQLQSIFTKHTGLYTSL